jgi:hypothetical protein
MNIDKTSTRKLMKVKPPGNSMFGLPILMHGLGGAEMVPAREFFAHHHVANAAPTPHAWAHMPPHSQSRQ